MKHEQLLHAIRAACDLSGDHELWIFGSQAILGNFQEAEQNEALSLSREVDMTPKNKLDKIDLIDGVLGEGSDFDEHYGFYVHGVPMHDAAYLPRDWVDRCVRVKIKGSDGNVKTAFCIEVHDLIVSKLARFAEKDIEFAETVIEFKMADPNRLLKRIEQTNDPRIPKLNMDKMKNWCLKEIESFNPGPSAVVGLPYGTILNGQGFEMVYPEDPKSDGAACGFDISSNIKCRRREPCTIHKKKC